MDITVCNPTFNREKTLTRAYHSLLNQTKKDFVWLIIDDGSTDNTKALVGKWIAEGKLQIDYHYKENGGKHTAMRWAFERTKTKYLIDLDSDDELTADAVETFDAEWKKIEEEDYANDFTEVRALTKDTAGALCGDYNFPLAADKIDSSWQEMVLKFRNNNENVTCWNLLKIRECVQIPHEF